LTNLLHLRWFSIPSNIVNRDGKMTWKFSGREEAFDYIEINNRSDKEIEEFLGKLECASLFSNKKICVSRQALLMLASLNEYDQKQVVREMYFVAANPSAKSVVRHKRNPLWRVFRTTYPFKNYHYLLTITFKSGKVVIHDISFDEELHGREVGRVSHQRTQMYHVQKGIESHGVYDGTQDEATASAMLGEWENGRVNPVAHIRTVHAAVNGMLNPYAKAVGLMGVHTEVAYKEDAPKEYTLFHNPSDGGVFDLIECSFDKTFFTSHNAQHLAAVMKQCAQSGKKVKWTVHSQGAIIFNSALEFIYTKNPSLRLTNQEVVVHAGGTRTSKIDRNAKLLGLKVNRHKTRTNPFDLVPNLAAREDKLTTSSLMRCIKFVGLVKGNIMTASPHTLPYFGLELYRKQLVMSGDDKALKRVKDIDKYIKKFGVK
ncbi:hypothetical protein, partial [Vibrio vulnificus]